MPDPTGANLTDSEVKRMDKSDPLFREFALADRLQELREDHETGEHNSVMTLALAEGHTLRAPGETGAAQKGSATIEITVVGNLNNGDKVNLIATNTTSVDFTVGDVAGGGVWIAEVDNDTSATNLAAAIDSRAEFSATVVGAVITVVQAVAGAASNTTVTLTDSFAAGMTKTDFAGGGGLGAAESEITSSIIFVSTTSGNATNLVFPDPAKYTGNLDIIITTISGALTVKLAGSGQSGTTTAANRRLTAISTGTKWYVNDGAEIVADMTA